MIIGRLQTLLAWVIITALVTWTAWPRSRPAEAPEDAQKRADDATAEDGTLRRVMMEFQVRYFVGAAQVVGEQRDAVAENIAMWNDGDIAQRVSFVVATGEFRGAAAALAELSALRELIEESEHRPTREESFVLELLERAYGDFLAGDPAAASLDESEREVLFEQLGWIGRLALAPGAREETSAKPAGEEGEEAAAEKADLPEEIRSERDRLLAEAHDTFVQLIWAFGAAVAIGVGGFVGLLVLLSRFQRRTVHFGIGGTGGYGGIYAETFAAWLVLFLGLSWAAETVPAGSNRFVAVGIVFVLSLLALAWPVMRGVPWTRVREDIGWTTGGARRKGWLEPFVGAATYVMSLPLLVLGVLVFFILLQQFAAPENADPLAPLDTPSHPIVAPFLAADWTGKVAVIFLACVAAPIVEETMFRGILYRHLREASAGWGLGRSALISAVISSFIFAVIHPQGFVAVPVLMSLAMGFCLAREWRSSLIASMVAHAINNGIALGVGFWILGA